MLQDTIFSEGEGDAWFKRNREPYDPELDPVFSGLVSQAIEPRDILEIGASRGDRLDALHTHYHANVTAVDPSAVAMADGRKTFPYIQFFAATASSLPLPSQTFDLVIASFVFHWIDRKSLLLSAAEIDRVLKPEGHLLIGDFAPFSPNKVRYHHRLDVEMYTYKQDYSGLFLATAGYVTIAQQILDHQSLKCVPNIPEHERFSITLLRKVTGGIYALYGESGQD
ncbi:MAG: methyltransferase domain-containing protein [Chthoniobacterales bacterium]